MNSFVSFSTIMNLFLFISKFSSVCNAMFQQSAEESEFMLCYLYEGN
jgi:hypothetical protein